jgi:hypothetical protein
MGRGSGNHWNEVEDAVIRSLWPAGDKAVILAALPGRSLYAAEHRASDLHVRRPNAAWTRTKGPKRRSYWRQRRMDCLAAGMCCYCNRLPHRPGRLSCEPCGKLKTGAGPGPPPPPAPPIGKDEFDRRWRAIMEPNTTTGFGEWLK